MNILPSFLVSVLCAPAMAGFLIPTDFPKVADDLSFVERMTLKSADYEQFETVYDANGKCISGCAYAKLNLEDELAAMQRWDAAVAQELTVEHGYTENPDGDIVPPHDNTPDAPAVDFPDQVANANCATHNPKFKSHDIPYGSPLGYVSCITSDYGAHRNLFGETKTHYGIDLAARIGMPIYAPADGTVVTVFNMHATCGNGIVIQHANGYRTQYCHLNEVSVDNGARVSAGCLIGKTGNTGRSTGPHLHYAVKKWNGKNYQSTNPHPFIEPEHRMCH